MKKYNVYVLEISVLGSLSDKSWRNIFYSTIVEGEKRSVAFQKVMGELKVNVLPHMIDGIGILAVYVGEVSSITGSANRLSPIRITKQELMESDI